jgi:phosphomannomutase
VEYADGFGLVRASNTTASLVLRFEGNNDEALQRITNDFKKFLAAEGIVF